MKLTSLEIKGFKSFADKTVINFNTNMTGIVGPNGCGKSNIVDAVRWVLGEQRPTLLRSEKMDSLIFNGTGKRRASGMAEVTLTFDNTRNILPTEFANVTISRTYYRNGESEYRLNNVPCRLKEIISLFMDTGVGSDSYAIIELKMVDDILSDKDDSRRRLFEQAAGIEKYKKRKKETLAKLSLTQADLDRVEDLLFEINNNLSTLQTQARRAKRYYNLKERYKQLSIDLAILMLHDQGSVFNEVNARLTEEQDKKLAVETQIQTQEAELEKLRAGNLDKEKALAEVQKALNSHTDLLRSVENEKNLLKEKMGFLQEKNAALTGEIDAARAKTGRLEATIEEKTAAIAATESEGISLSQQLEVIAREVAHATEIETSRQQELEAAQQNLNASEESLHNAEKDFAALEARQESLHEELANTGRTRKDHFEAHDQLSRQLKDLLTQKETAEADLHAAQRAHEENQLQFSENQKLLDQLRAEFQRHNRLLDAKRNELALTKNMIESLEGFPDSIRFLKQESRYAKDAPLVSDIFSCSDEYKVCIETFLEPYINHYVVNTLAEAVACIDLLSSAGKGKANFLVLEAMEGRDAPSVLTPEGTVAALDVIEVAPKYRALAAHLLGNVFIADDRTAIENPAKGAIILSRSGKYIRRQHGISGGSIGLFEGKRIGRIKQVARLEEDIQQLERGELDFSQKIGTLESAQRKLQESSNEARLLELRETVAEINTRVAATKSRVEHLEELLTSAEARTTYAGDRRMMLEQQRNELTQRIGDLKAGLEVLKQAFHRTRAAHDEAQAERARLQQKLHEMNLTAQDHRHKVDTLSKELSFNQDLLTETTESITSAERRMEENAAELLRSEARLAEIEAQLAELYNERDRLQSEVAEAEQRYFTSRATIHELEEEVRQLSRQRQTFEELINNYRDKISEMKVGLAGLKERLSVEFNVDLNALADQQPSSEATYDELRTEVTDVKAKIDNYGEINPMAVEAYTEMEERFNFITAQKNDLVTARENLENTIKEIDQTASERFMHAFESARERFKEVFKSLFNPGDDCDLILLNPSDPLESKIEVIARPKGKRPITINQLSGGEKALTAIALLFALYLIKPAPFCIFDEVDAPLDDANINKFTQIISKFSKDSQFIIVTHNKQTMAAVDAIYGVTMPEQGVSKVVPVNFGSLN